MSGETIFVSVVGPRLECFIAHRRSLGMRCDIESRILAGLDSFLYDSAASELTPQAFDAWCACNAHLAASTRRNLMTTVYRFCIYRRRNEPACFVPDTTLFPKRRSRQRPHIFSQEEITRMLSTADELPAYKFSPLYPQVARIALVLLYTTGLRRGELVRLTLGDYDSDECVLHSALESAYFSPELP